MGHLRRGNESVIRAVQLVIHSLAHNGRTFLEILCNGFGLEIWKLHGFNSELMRY